MSANDGLWLDWGGESTSHRIDKRLRAGLALLWRAYLCAYVSGTSVWDLALPTGKLYEAGMTSGDLRWLVAGGFAEHGQETPAYHEMHRSFRRRLGDFFNEHTCLVLTPKGAALAEHFFVETTKWPQRNFSAIAAVTDPADAFAAVRHTAYEASTPVTPALKPHWNATWRELSLGGLVVKRFRVPARNQETILSVFEEEAWAEHIHDPLPVTHDIDAPTRLHDAINRLNRCQINPLLRFHGDGKGTGVLWRFRRLHLNQLSRAFH